MCLYYKELFSFKGLLLWNENNIIIVQNFNVVTTFKFSICYKIIVWFSTGMKDLQIMRKLYLNLLYFPLYWLYCVRFSLSQGRQLIYKKLERRIILESSQECAKGLLFNLDLIYKITDFSRFPLIFINKCEDC